MISILAHSATNYYVNIGSGQPSLLGAFASNRLFTISICLLAIAAIYFFVRRVNITAVWRKFRFKMKKLMGALGFPNFLKNLKVKLKYLTTFIMVFLLIASGCFYAFISHGIHAPSSGKKLILLNTYEESTASELESFVYADNYYLTVPSVDDPFLAPRAYVSRLELNFQEVPANQILWLSFRGLFRTVGNFSSFSFNFSLQELETAQFLDLNFTTAMFNVSFCYDFPFMTPSRRFTFLLNFTAWSYELGPPLGILFFIEQFILFEHSHSII